LNRGKIGRRLALCKRGGVKRMKKPVGDSRMIFALFRYGSLKAEILPLWRTGEDDNVKKTVHSIS